MSVARYIRAKTDDNVTNGFAVLENSCDQVVSPVSLFIPPASFSLVRLVSLSLSLSLFAASRRICVTYPDGVLEINNLTGAYPIY